MTTLRVGRVSVPVAPHATNDEAAAILKTRGYDTSNPNLTIQLLVEPASSGPRRDFSQPRAKAK